jgi:hypothetical protein
MSDSHEIRVLLAPIPGGALVIPGSVVAEVVDFTEPQSFGRGPEWLLGEIGWNVWKIPLVSLSLLAGTSNDTRVSPRSRLLVLKTLTEESSVLHVAVPISGLPRLLRVSRGSLEEVDGETPPGIFTHVVIDNQPGLIPDLEALAKTIEEAVYRNH